MKIAQTFTIDINTLKEFKEIAKLNSLNKSAFVENCIKEYLKNNKKDDTNENSKGKSNR